jgi:hypothetical protein
MTLRDLSVAAEGSDGLLACGPAAGRKFMPGTERRCPGCDAAIFVSADASDKLIPACLPCTRALWDGQAVGLTPFGRAVADAHSAGPDVTEAFLRAADDA